MRVGATPAGAPVISATPRRKHVFNYSLQAAVRFCRVGAIILHCGNIDSRQNTVPNVKETNALPATPVKYAMYIDLAMHNLDAIKQSSGRFGRCNGPGLPPRQVINQNSAAREFRRNGCSGPQRSNPQARLCAALAHYLLFFIAKDAINRKSASTGGSGIAASPWTVRFTCSTNSAALAGKTVASTFLNSCMRVFRNAQGENGVTLRSRR